MSESGLDGAVEQHHQALGEFVKGDAEPLKALFSHRDDVTLANPFGPAVTGWEEAAATMERAASLYRDGEIVGFDTLAKKMTAELGYTVEVKRYSAKLGGRKDLTPVTLRVTCVFRPEEGSWKLVHRHADPITTARTADSVVQHP